MNSQSARLPVSLKSLSMLWLPTVLLCLAWIGFAWTSLRADEIYEQRAIGAVIFPGILVAVALGFVVGVPALLVAMVNAIAGTWRGGGVARYASTANWAVLAAGALFGVAWGLYFLEGAVPEFGWLLARFLIAVALVASMVVMRLVCRADGFAAR